MNLHQYRVLTALAAKLTTTEEEREAIEGVINYDPGGFCQTCHNVHRNWSGIPLFHIGHGLLICRECADKGE